jgi:hypothetical protein
MSRRQDLQDAIEQSYEIIRGYQDVVRTSSRPEEVERAQRLIGQYWALIREDLEEYRRILPDPSTWPTDLREIAAHWLDLPASESNAGSPAPLPQPDPEDVIPVEPGGASSFSYIVGPPITDPRSFFGRQRELRRLFNLWRRPPLQNAAVVGPRRSGKTSLLLHLENITLVPRMSLRPSQRAGWLLQEGQCRWIFVDFQDPRLSTRSGLLRYLLGSLNVDVPEPCNLERCMEILIRELRSPTVILMDEIDVALQRHHELDDVFWESLRALATNLVDGNLGFVLASSEPPDQLARHSDIGSPFFNIFGYVAAVGPLSEQAARELVASSPYPFPPADIEWILAQSGRWPVLLQILCRERLFALEEGDTSDTWRQDALRQMTHVQHMLTS